MWPNKAGETQVKIELYYAPITCALAPYITLTEAGADFEVHPLNMRKEEHKSAKYLEINPKHKVPLLVVDGFVLSESTAIQMWIARAFPKARLLPSTYWQELKAISILSWCSSGIHPFLARINSPAKVCSVLGADESVRDIASQQLFENFQIADDMLAGREYFFDHFTASDAHFYWCYRRATQFNLDLSGFKNCNAHFDRMEHRSSVRKLLDYEKEVLKSFNA